MPPNLAAFTLLAVMTATMPGSNIMVAGLGAAGPLASVPPSLAR